MFAKSALVFLFFALCGLVAAFPPACVIGAVNTQKTPSDFGTVCGSANNAVQKQIAKFCADDVDTGLKTFKTICSDAGHDIKLIDTTTSSSSSSSSTATKTGSMTPTGTSSPTTTGSGSSPTSTHNAGSLHQADSVFMALVVAIVGAIAL